MKNFLQPGDCPTITAPTGGVTSGQGVLLGTMFGVAVSNADEGEPVAVKMTGVFELPKTSAQAWTMGAKVYWDDGNSVATTTASGNTLIGHAFAVAENPSATGQVRLSW